MTPGERIDIKKRLADELAGHEWPEIDLILSEFNQVVVEDWRGDKKAYVIEMLRDAQDNELAALAEYLLGEGLTTPMPHGAGPWAENRPLRLFMSHLAKERELVGRVQTYLAWNGIDAFVAHNDIEPSQEWVSEIEMALWTCDALVAFLHEGFTDSHWCDQEVGFAYGLRKVVLPLAFDELPYGFLMKFQAVKCGSKSASAIAEDIVEALMKRDELREQVIDAQLAGLVGSPNFATSNEIGKRLGSAHPEVTWSDSRLAQLREALDNDQVASAYDAAPWAQRMLRKHEKPLEPPPPPDDDVPF